MRTITDEVYEHIVYALAGIDTYMASLPGMRSERTISCSFLSKMYFDYGWRLDTFIAAPQITERIKKVHDFLIVGAGGALQEGVVARALRFDQSAITTRFWRFIHISADLFCKGLDELGLIHNTPEGALLCAYGHQ